MLFKHLLAEVKVTFKMFFSYFVIITHNVCAYIPEGKFKYFQETNKHNKIVLQCYIHAVNM